MPLREAGGSIGPDNMSSFSARGAIAVNPLLERFQQGAISEAFARKAMRSTLFPLYNDTLAAEKAVMAERDAATGMKTLTTDSFGAHDLRWFEKTGLAFATGIPTSGLVVAFSHPDVGISASHQNLITVEDIVNLILNSANSPMAQGMIEQSPESSVARMIASFESMATIARSATARALTGFAELSRGGVPINGTNICILGGDFLSESQCNRLYDVIAATVQTHRAMNDGRAKHVVGGRTLNLQNKIGSRERSGVIWGGPQHPLYPQLSFYQN